MLQAVQRARQLLEDEEEEEEDDKDDEAVQIVE